MKSSMHLYYYKNLVRILFCLYIVVERFTSKYKQHGGSVFKP